jgi:hypothetical protein
MRQVADMLERPYRLVAEFSTEQQQQRHQHQHQRAGSISSGGARGGGASSSSGGGPLAVWLPTGSYQSLPPAAGEYDVEVHIMQAGQCIWGSQNCFEDVGRGRARLSAEGVELLLAGGESASGWPDAALVAMDFV